MEHHVKASSFADPGDVARFRRCKAGGGSDQECFKVGDNGVGCWGDDTSEGSGPSCALPPEDMAERWGSKAAARRKKVLVVANGRQVVCLLKDTMPHRANIKNGAGIDLNPDAVKALGLAPPIMVPAVWSWAA
jgi:hypothetical protein